MSKTTTARWAAGAGAMLIGLGLGLGGVAWAEDGEPDPSPTVAPIEDPTTEPDPVQPTEAPEPEPTTPPIVDPVPVEEPTAEPDPVAPTNPAPEPEPEPTVAPTTAPEPTVTVPAVVPSQATTSTGPRVQAAGQAPVAPAADPGQQPVSTSSSRLSRVLHAVAWQATDTRGRAQAQAAEPAVSTPQAADEGAAGVPVELPLTGDETGPLAALAACLMAAGGGLVVWARRARA